MENFKIRCSAISKIMGVKGLGKTGINYAMDWLKSKKLNRTLEVSSKFLSKGNIVEYESIMMLSNYMGLEMEKNEQSFENDYLTGTPDIILEDCVIDVKNSWSWKTFPLLEKEIPNDDYYYQLQGYMELTGKKSAKLVYILSDTPEFLIEKEAFYYCRNQGFEELDLDVFDKFKADMTYSDLWDSQRIKIYEIAYNEEIIAKIYDRVKECRTMLKNL